MTPEETWKLCLNFCEKELSKQQYTTWIKPLSGDVDEKLKQLTISAPNQFVLQWVKERLNDKLHNLLEESSNISSITYNVNKKTKRSLSVEAIITESPDPKKSSQSQQTVSTKALILITLLLEKQISWLVPLQSKLQKSPEQLTTLCLFMVGWV